MSDCHPPWQTTAPDAPGRHRIWPQSGPACQRTQRLHHALFSLPGDGKPRQMPAALHQLKVIKRFEVGFCSRQRGDDRVIRVVNQHQNVRQLQRRRFANLDARGQSVNNRALGGTNQAGGTRLIVVTLQIKDT